MRSIHAGWTGVNGGVHAYTLGATSPTLHRFGAPCFSLYYVCVTHTMCTILSMLTTLHYISGHTHMPPPPPPPTSPPWPSRPQRPSDRQSIPAVTLILHQFVHHSDWLSLLSSYIQQSGEAQNIFLLLQCRAQIFNEERLDQDWMYQKG